MTMTTTTICILLAIFALIYICTAHALGQTGFRDGRFVLAFPVSTLCVLSLLRGGGDIQKNFTLDLLLIPYRTLACLLILIAILWILSLLFRSRIPKMLMKRYDLPKSENEYSRKTHRAINCEEKRLKENQDELP